MFWGYVDMVEGLVRRMRAELGGAAVVRGDRRPRRQWSRRKRTLIEHVDPELTLRGLRLVWERTHVIDVESYCRDSKRISAARTTVT